MGDLVLTEAEITPVLPTAFVQNGFDITAIYNHVLRGNPADVLYARRSTR